MKTNYQYFIERVQKTDTCWIWVGTLTVKGYGRFARSKNNRHKAHRWSYEHFVGPIAEGLTIDHLCRVRACVNPAHLEAVTIQENLSRAPRGTYNWQDGKCKRGHDLAIVGYRERPKKGRECMGCRKEQSKRSYMKKCATVSV
jgi:hypothetical protein